MIYKCGDPNFKYAWLDYIAQDPVHPTITPYDRIIRDRTVFVYAEGADPQFIVSAKMGESVARSMKEVMSDDVSGSKRTATFYSIFRVPGQGLKGRGGKVLRSIVDYCKLRGTEEFFTLSPIPFLKNEFVNLPKKAELVKYLEKKIGPVERFHLGNGAVVAHVNFDADESDIRQEESWGTMINYQYEYK